MCDCGLDCIGVGELVWVVCCDVWMYVRVASMRCDQSAIPPILRAAAAAQQPPTTEARSNHSNQSILWHSTFSVGMALTLVCVVEFMYAPALLAAAAARKERRKGWCSFPSLELLCCVLGGGIDRLGQRVMDITDRSIRYY